MCELWTLKINLKNGTKSIKIKQVRLFSVHCTKYRVWQNVNRSLIFINSKGTLCRSKSDCKSSFFLYNRHVCTQASSDNITYSYNTVSYKGFWQKFGTVFKISHCWAKGRIRNNTPQNYSDHNSKKKIYRIIFLCDYNSNTVNPLCTYGHIIKDMTDSILTNGEFLRPTGCHGVKIKDSSVNLLWNYCC